ncbi:hypothetical protein HHK36_032656 [Tetracentron sinense]|uniref:RRM domain-containing protein n=1 Tax=Tetracentron sinense TaxID=13715 RepID=A0A834Y9X7_TETSI|nr:hypothetical protein HHK36_032656 [Tetracentron sinense]
MASNQGNKIFIGKILPSTSEDKLREHFENYGVVLEAVIMRDYIKERPRGFGFVVFADSSVLDRVLQDKHSIDGRTLKVERPLSREELLNSSRYENLNARGNIMTKIFVGGLPPTLTEEEFRHYFEAYGHVTDVVIMYDKTTQRPGGFGFISFDSKDIVDTVLHKKFHKLNGKSVEVKRALSKDAYSVCVGRSMDGGNYWGYGAFSANSNTSTYEGQIDSNRYMLPQTTGGGYEYGVANSGVGYGGYSVSGYGNASAWYGDPTWAYVNAPYVVYENEPLGAQRSPWINQVHSGYGSASYGANMGYVNATSWTAPAAASSGGSVSATTGQSLIGDSGYRSEGYGFVGYGGSGWSYSHPGGYGSVGRHAGAGGSYGTAQASGPPGWQVGYGGAP